MVQSLGLEDYVDLFDAHYRAFDDLTALVHRCWDVEAMRDAYRSYLKLFGPVRQHYENVDPGDDVKTAFVDYVAGLHEWRKLPYLDPGLPSDLLPDDWQGSRAITLFSDLRSDLEPTAKRHVTTSRRQQRATVGSPSSRHQQVINNLSVPVSKP